MIMTNSGITKEGKIILITLAIVWSLVIGGTIYRFVQFYSHEKHNTK
jgi:hypothetical protein